MNSDDWEPPADALTHTWYQEETWCCAVTWIPAGQYIRMIYTVTFGPGPDDTEIYKGVERTQEGLCEDKHGWLTSCDLPTRLLDWLHNTAASLYRRVEEQNAEQKMIVPQSQEALYTVLCTDQKGNILRMNLAMTKEVVDAYVRGLNGALPFMCHWAVPLHHVPAANIFGDGVE